MQAVCTVWSRLLDCSQATPIIRRSDCVSLPMVFCPVIAVVMLESRDVSCVHCVE